MGAVLDVAPRASTLTSFPNIEALGLISPDRPAFSVAPGRRTGAVVPLRI